MFATDQGEFFVEPLWNDTRNMHQEGRHHVVYKRSAIRDKHKERHCGVSGKTGAKSVTAGCQVGQVQRESVRGVR